MSDMTTPEQIEDMRVAIAEKCGYNQPFEIKESWFETRESNGFENVLVDADNRQVPNYPEDLNAMHGAVVSSLDYDTSFRFMEILEDLLERDTPESDRGNRDFIILQSTALQRAEAFCRTLKIGPWKEQAK